MLFAQFGGLLKPRNNGAALFCDWNIRAEEFLSDVERVRHFGPAPLRSVLHRNDKQKEQKLLNKKETDLNVCKKRMEEAQILTNILLTSATCFVLYIEIY